MGAIGARKEMAMRSREFLLCVFSIGVVVFFAAPAAAQAELPLTCNTGEGGANKWDITVAKGPCPVDCGSSLDTSGNLECYEGGACTGVEYEIVGRVGADHVAVLARGPVVDPAEAFAPCEGDPVTGLGVHTCHEQTIRYNAAGEKRYSFYYVVDGNREVSTTTVAVRKGNTAGSCEIIGVGQEVVVEDSGYCVPSCGDFDENQTITRREVLNFKGCWLQFDFDLNTGAVVSVAKVDSETPGDPPKEQCDFLDFPVGQLQVIVPGGPAEYATFGDGFISSGIDSCSCRVIGGRVYCWGRPCPR